MKTAALQILYSAKPGAAWFHKTITPGWWSVIWHIFKNKWDKIFQLQTNLTSFYPEPSICLNCSATNYPGSRELPQRITKRCLLREINCWSDSHLESSWRGKKKKKQTNSQQMRHWCLVLCLQRSLLCCVCQDFFGSCFLKICVSSAQHMVQLKKQKKSSLQKQFYEGWENLVVFKVTNSACNSAPLRALINDLPLAP